MNEIELVGAASHLGELSSRLLKAAPNEAAAILLCHAHDTPSCRRRVLVREVLDVPQQFYLEQQPDRVSIDPIFLAHAFRRARDEESSILFAHTHPLSRWPEFSLVDDHGESRLIPVVFGRIEKRPHGSLVLGVEGFSGRLYSRPDYVQPVKTMVSIGRDVWRNTKDDPSVPVDSMHDRNVRAFGAGQQKLQRMRVGIAGLGWSAAWLNFTGPTTDFSVQSGSLSDPTGLLLTTGNSSGSNSAIQYNDYTRALSTPLCGRAAR